DVKGDLDDAEVDRSGGRIRAPRASGGALHIQKAGGDVDLDEAPHGAIINTGGGDIHVGPGSGTLEAHTGGGSIEVGPIAGSVEAGTGAGAVRVMLADAHGETQNVEVNSGTGKVIVELPAGFD